MSVTLIGGIDRLRHNYIRIAQNKGINLKCLLHDSPDFKTRIGTPDVVVIFTNQISHEARRKAVEHARQMNIQLYLLHSCSVTTLNHCLANC